MMNYKQALIVSFMLKHNSYNGISQPNLTYQNTNAIVKSYILEDGNRINQLKYNIAEKFNSIHYIYSFLYAKIYNRTNSWYWKKERFRFSIPNVAKRKTAKIYCQRTEQLCNRKIEKEEQAPLDEDKINNKKIKLNKKRKMLEEKLEKNNEAMKKIKMKKNDIFLIVNKLSNIL